MIEASSSWSRLDRLLGGPGTLIRKNAIGWVGFWHAHVADSRSGLDKLAAAWLGSPTPS
jgi:hypothetical protein